ncbi:MAG: OmpA family protein [Chitinophagales bacterium]|nr:OmpA family protein [Chitinophagales bacterium]
MLGMLLPFFAIAQVDSTQADDYRSERLKNLSPKKKMKIANSLTEKGSYYNALMYYEEVYAKKPDNACAVSRLAKLNYLLRDYQAAEKWYKVFYELDTTEYAKAKYMMALMQKYNGKCDEANGNFKSFLAAYDGEDKNDFKKTVERQMQGCDLAIKTLADPERVIVELLDQKVNNPFSDFAPKPVGKDQLLFSSLRSDTAISVAASDSTGQKARQFLTTRQGTSWADAQLYPAASNTKEFHTGNGTLSPDGKRFYFTNCVVGDSLQMECEIYMSENNNGTWSEAKKLGGSINDGSNNTHPHVAVVNNKEYLFFTSNREGGVGGTDIYYAESDGKGGFDKAKNIGKNVNTSGNEVTPFMDGKKSTLYFSSDGMVSIGGFDIYKTTFVNGECGVPENLLAPLNSSVDDIYFALSDDQKTGYLVSNRPGGYSLKSPTCCDDIYSFRIVTDIILEAYVANKKDPETPIEGADVSFFVRDSSGMLMPIANLTTTKDEVFYLPLDPEKVYKVNVTKTGYWGSEETLDMPALNVKDTLKRVFYIEEIQRRKIQLKRIYYEFDKYAITKPYKVTLDSLSQVLAANPTWTLEIYGHTDSVGSDAYNMVLAKKRAQAAADYLAAKGIDINRMSLMAKGESEPIAPNTTASGKDNPEGRAKNRRVEFKVNSNDKQVELEVEYSDLGPYTYDKKGEIKPVTKGWK